MGICEKDDVGLRELLITSLFLILKSGELDVLLFLALPVLVNGLTV